MLPLEKHNALNITFLFPQLNKMYFYTQTIKAVVKENYPVIESNLVLVLLIKFQRKKLEAKTN
jgi:hypothetical protein